MSAPIMSPLSQRGGDMLVYLLCRRSNMRRWPNSGLMLSNRLRRWPNLSPVLVTVSCLENPALVQSIVPVLMTVQRAWSTDSVWMDTFNRHWGGVGLYSPQAVCTADPRPSKHEALNQCWFKAGPASQTVGQNWTSIGSTSRVWWECWQATLCFTHRRVWRY